MDSKATLVYGRTQWMTNKQLYDHYTDLYLFIIIENNYNKIYDTSTGKKNMKQKQNLIPV